MSLSEVTRTKCHPQRVSGSVSERFHEGISALQFFFFTEVGELLKRSRELKGAVSLLRGTWRNAGSFLFELPCSTCLGTRAALVIFVLAQGYGNAAAGAIQQRGELARAELNPGTRKSCLCC